MAIFRGPGGSGDATTDSTTQALAATQAAADALASKNAAAASATSAATSATSATSSASSATASATSASTSATTATNQANIAGVHKDAASIFATNAATSSITAATQATNAATSATNAANSATLAATYTPSQTGNSGKLLTTDGTNTSWKGVTGSGSVVLGVSALLQDPTFSQEIYFTSNYIAGTNAQGQGALTADVAVITTTAANPSGVTLPTTTKGRRVIVVNNGTNPINVYPASGSSIDALATNSPINIPINGRMEFNAISTTQWYSTANITINTLPVSRGGTGVTTSTGSGDNVLNTSPTLITPVLGTPTSVTLTNATGLPVTGISATGTPSSTTYLRGDSTWSTIPAGMVYPSAGIPKSTGTAWGTSYSVTGTGSVVLNNDPFFDTDIYVSDMRIGRGNQANSLVFGQGALFNNTTGDFNSAVGVQALGLNTTGNNNTALGSFASYRNTTASNNTAIGYASLLNNANGISNTAVGSSALTNLKQAGIDGLSVLSSSIYSVGTYTTYNASLVYVSGTASTTGNYGTIALYFDGDGLLASFYMIDHGSGFTDLTTVVKTSDFYIDNFDISFNITSLIYPSQNTALGYLSGSTVSSGSDNILIGHNAQTAGDSTDNEIVIGSGSVGKGSNSITLGNSSHFAGTTYIRTPVVRFIDGSGNNYYGSTIYSNIVGSISSGNGSFNNLSATGSLQLTGSDTVNQNIATTQTTGSLTIGGTGATGAITLGQSSSAQTVQIGGAGSSIVTVGGGTGTGTLTFGRSTGAQTVNIATGVNVISAKTVNIGTGGTGGTNNINIGPTGTVSGQTTINIGTQARTSNPTTVNIGTNATGGNSNINIGSSGAATVIKLSGIVQPRIYTNVNLQSTTAGNKAFVSDHRSNVAYPVFGEAYSTSGTFGPFNVPVFADGTIWRVG